MDVGTSGRSDDWRPFAASVSRPPHPGTIELWRDGEHVETVAAGDIDPRVSYHLTFEGWVPVVRVEWLAGSDGAHVCRKLIGPGGRMLAVDYLLPDVPDGGASAVQAGAGDVPVGQPVQQPAAGGRVTSPSLAGAWEAWAASRIHQLAITSIVVGVLGLLVVGYLLGPVALFLGSSAVTPDTPPQTRRLALIGMILGTLALVGHLLLLL